MAHVEHSDWTFGHSSTHWWGVQPDAQSDVSGDISPPTHSNSVASVLKTLWHQGDATGAAPTLTVTSNALTVDAGGSTTLPITVSPPSGHQATSVTITGLTSYRVGD